MAMRDDLWVLLILALLLIVALAIVYWLIRGQLQRAPERIDQTLSERHRSMLADLHGGLADNAQRIATSQSDSTERLRQSVSGEMREQHAMIATLAQQQTERLAENRSTLERELAQLKVEVAARQDSLKQELLTRGLEQLAEQGRAQQRATTETLQDIRQQLALAIEGLAKGVDARLNELSGRVNERLEEGFKKTNETFTSVLLRLQTIDDAQKKIEGLTTNVVSLQQLLGDKRSRGALGEMQLEQLVRNILPESAFEFQYTFANRVRADCVLKLPEPTGLVAIDSKFPLENYERMLADPADKLAVTAFKIDVKKHIDDVGSKYIIAGETSDGAVLFVPAEAVFAEIHGHHRDLVEYALTRRVWIVSPTTLMAVLNTARAVLKDVETRKQVHIIKDELGKLAGDFGRFQQRMDNLAKHIDQAKRDVDDVNISSRKITERFQRIERAELTDPDRPELKLVSNVTDNPANTQKS